MRGDNSSSGGRKNIEDFLIVNNGNNGINSNDGSDGSNSYKNIHNENNSNTADNDNSSIGDNDMDNITDNKNEYLIELNVIRGCSSTEWVKGRGRDTKALTARIVKPPQLPYYDQRPTLCIYRGVYRSVSKDIDTDKNNDKDNAKNISSDTNNDKNSNINNIKTIGTYRSIDREKNELNDSDYMIEGYVYTSLIAGEEKEKEKIVGVFKMKKSNMNWLFNVM